MPATNDQQPDHTAPEPNFDADLSLRLDRARLAFEAAVAAGDPTMITTTADELRRLEALIPEGDDVPG